MLAGARRVTPAEQHEAMPALGGVGGAGRAVEGGELPVELGERQLGGRDRVEQVEQLAIPGEELIPLLLVEFGAGQRSEHGEPRSIEAAAAHVLAQARELGAIGLRGDDEVGGEADAQ
jgi:hypothetical protein